MPKGFKRTNKAIKLGMRSQLHSERQTEKEFIKECINDYDTIQIYRKIYPEKHQRINRDTNTKKKFNNDRDYNRSIKYDL